MAETFNDDLSFLVLDDVVNSFDRDHRGRLAELLVSQFSDKQLIILTHDEQFYDRICRLAPSWIGEQFTSWSYSDGPRTRRHTAERFLAEAGEELSVGNRVGAAQKGRRALEEFLQEACEELEALLPFRRGQRNDRRMADEVMKGLRRALRDRAKPLYQRVSPLLQLLGSGSAGSPECRIPRESRSDIICGNQRCPYSGRGPSAAFHLQQLQYSGVA